MTKRKRAGVHHNRTATSKRGSKNRSVDLNFNDDNIESDDDSDDGVGSNKGGNLLEQDINSIPEPEETTDEKRVRLAKEYLEKLAQSQAQVREMEGDASDDEFFNGGIQGGEVDEAINQQLMQDALDKSGKASVLLADKLASGLLQPTCRAFRAHRLPVTCVSISEDGSYGFSGSKDCKIIRWDLNAGRRLLTFAGRPSTKTHKANPASSDFNTDQVLGLALSDDGKYLASGGKDRILRIWNPTTGACIDKFRGHLGDINGLAFQRGGSYNLFTASSDRTIKVWNVKDAIFVETLYGHQDKVFGIDSHRKERCITVGNDDTARLWKVPEEVQLILRGAQQVSVDCIAMVNEQYFVTGSNDGSLALWDIGKKKPIFTVRNAHAAVEEDAAKDSEEAEQERGSSATAWPSSMPHDSTDPKWITSVAAVRNGDVVASGSWDGFVRLWHCVLTTTASDGSHQRRQLRLLCVVEIPGFVNGLAFSKSGERLLAGVGQEHKLGRWWRDNEVRNSVVVIDLVPADPEDSDASDEEGESQEEE